MNLGTRARIAVLIGVALIGLAASLTTSLKADASIPEQQRASIFHGIVNASGQGIIAQPATRNPQPATGNRQPATRSS